MDVIHSSYNARTLTCLTQLAAPTLSEPLSRFAPQRAHSSYFWPSSFHFQRQSCISSKHLSGFLMAKSLALGAERSPRMCSDLGGGADGRDRWIRAIDLRPASSSQP